MRSFFVWVLAALGAVAGCAEQLADRVVLQPGADDVEIATEPPSAHAYRLVGEVSARAAAGDLDIAEQAARNDLRNKAAALGASLVTIDEDRGDPILFEGKTKVTLTGRAYKSID